MFFLFLEYDLKYSNFKVSLRKFALKQLSIKTHDFFTDDPKAFIPGDTSRCISAGTLLVTLMNGLSIRLNDDAIITRFG